MWDKKPEKGYRIVKYVRGKIVKADWKFTTGDGEWHLLDSVGHNMVSYVIYEEPITNQCPEYFKELE